MGTTALEPDEEFLANYLGGDNGAACLAAVTFDPSVVRLHNGDGTDEERDAAIDAVEKSLSELPQDISKASSDPRLRLRHAAYSLAARQRSPQEDISRAAPRTTSDDEEVRDYLKMVHERARSRRAPVRRTVAAHTRRPRGRSVKVAPPPVVASAEAPVAGGDPPPPASAPSRAEFSALRADLDATRDELRRASDTIDRLVRIVASLEDAERFVARFRNGKLRGLLPPPDAPPPDPVSWDEAAAQFVEADPARFPSGLTGDALRERVRRKRDRLFRDVHAVRRGLAPEVVEKLVEHLRRHAQPPHASTRIVTLSTGSVSAPPRAVRS